MSVDFNQLYRNFTGAHTAEANMMEMLYNELAKMFNENVKLQASLVDKDTLINKLQKKK